MAMKGFSSAGLGKSTGEEHWAVFPERSDQEDESWMQFSDAESSTASLQYSVFAQLFPVEENVYSHRPGGLLQVDNSLWSALYNDSLSPGTSLPSLTARASETRPPSLDLPADCTGFEWSAEEPLEVMPTLFKPSKPESPIDIQFDHSRAALGLASLTLEELRCMNEEMRSKFTHMSRSLVEGLEERDQLAGELDVKNRFVSAILRVQSLRVKGGAGEEVRGGRRRAWSVKQYEDKPSRKYLESVLPYHRPEDLRWSSDVLTTLTGILLAIADDSDRVPTLVAEYIQEHILESSRGKWTEQRNSKPSTS